MCGLRKDHTAAVVEMGVSMPGEMARIAAVVKPTCAVMTNIGVSHIEFMKTRENILKEKAHIADYLPGAAPCSSTGMTTCSPPEGDPGEQGGHLWLGAQLRLAGLQPEGSG